MHETRQNSIRPTVNDSDEFDDDDDDENLDDSMITHSTCGLTMMSDDDASDTAIVACVISSFI